VKVRRGVLAVEHRNDYSKEPADFRHASPPQAPKTINHCSGATVHTQRYWYQYPRNQSLVPNITHMTEMLPTA
jgi:hypothetical protein